MKARLIPGLLIMTLALPSVAWGQEPYPSRPISLVVTFSPGGTADLVARAVSPSLERVLKNPVIVLNKVGAAGAVGTSFVAHAKPDGYTLLLSLSTISILPEADMLFDGKPTYTMDQFTPIALISADPTLLVARAERPWKTLKEFVEDARGRPGEVPFGSAGPYSPMHLAVEMLSHAAGIKLRHIPFVGAGPALAAILGGHVDAMAPSPAPTLPHVKAGKLRPLAGSGAKRMPALPDIPTFKELGYDIEIYVWAGIFAPTGTPEPVIRKLREAVGQAVKEAEFKAAMAKLEVPIAYLDAPDFQKFWERDAKMLADAVRRVGKVEVKK